MKLLLLCFFLAICHPTYSAEWSYDTTANNGPPNWATYLTSQNVDHECGGTKQSPIDITSASTDSSLPAFDSTSLDGVPTAATLSNNGHTVQLTITTGGVTVQNFLPNDYTVAQCHLHWGNGVGSTQGGSEHTLNGKQYFGELHIVMYKTSLGSLTAALQQDEGLAVLGFFIDADYPQDNCAFGKLMGDILSQVDNKDKTYTVTSANFASLETILPGNLAVYYRYSGSLTTPNCYQSVIWTVFEQPIRISTTQATALTTTIYASTDTSSLLTNNFRPVQNLNGRKITKSSSTLPRMTFGLLIILQLSLFKII